MDNVDIDSESFTTISKMAEAHLIHVKNEIQEKEKLIENLKGEIEKLSVYFNEKLELLNNFQAR